jgi:tetratricopeptide (TPR) repeat protein
MNSDTLHRDRQPQPEETSETDLPEQRSGNKGIATLPIVDPVFADEEVPEDIVQEIVFYLFQDESIFALFRLDASYSFSSESGKVERVPLWMVITGTRLLLLAVSSEGQTYCETFKQHTPIEYHDGLARDKIKIADSAILIGIWEKKRKLFKEAIHLFRLPEYEKYLYIADMYLKKEEYAPAVPLLQKSLELVPTIKAYLLLVYALSRIGTPDKALDVLQQTYQLAEPASVLQELQLLFPENLVMFLYHAVICEKNQWWDDCINIYHLLLQKTPDFDLYFLKLGEMYNFKQEYQTAIEYYQKFIKLRTESEKFEEGDFITWDLSDSRYFAADPDLTKAFFDIGVIHENVLHDPEEAFSIYLSLLRHAPFYPETYKHFWQVYQQLLQDQESQFQDQRIHIKAFLQVYRLLDPVGYASVVNIPGVNVPGTSEVSGTLGEQIADLPFAYRALSHDDHDTLTHPGEHEYWRRIQNWLTSLVISEEDGQGIEQYCEQVGASNYPQLFHTIERVTALLAIEPPKCFISRGKIGISIKNKERPFIFIGSEHLQEGTERYFSESELLFVITAQAEHIKSGHLLITETELWKSLGTVSFDGFLTALQCLPAGSFIGRVTYRFATEGLKRVYKMTKYSSVQRILKFFEKKGTDQSLEDMSEIEESKTIARKNGRPRIQKQPEPDSLLKEQIVDFARHAVYTADRVGLLACNDIGAACSAIFKVTSNTSDDLEKLRHEGLLPVLERKDKRGNFMYFEYAKRFSELIKFALSEEYLRIHKKIVILSENQTAGSDQSSHYTSEHKNLLDNLQLLEQSRQRELLTAEEFLSKQKNLLNDSGLLLQEDGIVVDKFQQACRDGVLTYEELQTKIFQLLETRVKGEG